MATATWQRRGIFFFIVPHLFAGSVESKSTSGRDRGPFDFRAAFSSGKEKYLGIK
jgi:hypothetical protein